MEAFIAAICDYVKESVLKIGDDGCDISLNFPPQTIKSLFGNRTMTQEELSAAEEHAKAAFPYGGLSFLPFKDLVVVTVDGAAVRKICSLPKTKKDEFLLGLVALSADTSATFQTVRALFEKFDTVYRWEGVDGEYDEVLCFAHFDDFCYCLSYEPGGVHYHRLLKEDFDALYPEKRTRIP